MEIKDGPRMRGWTAEEGLIGQSAFQLPTSRVHPCRSLLFVFTLIFILVSHREGTKIKVKNMVKIKWNTTRIFIYLLS